MIYINPNPQERETSIKTYPLKSIPRMNLETSSAAALILQGDPTFTKKDCKSKLIQPFKHFPKTMQL